MIKASFLGAALAATLLLSAACTSFPSSKFDAAAIDSLRAMSKKLANAEALQFRTKNTYDATLAEHLGSPRSATAEISLERPRHLHGHISGSGGANQDVYLDGKFLTIHDGKLNLYAIAAINRPNIDKSLELISAYYGFTPPLADFVGSNPFKNLTRNMESGRHLGTETIGADECEHLAFSGPELDWELWLTTKNHLPRRYIITVKSLADSPRFTADFEKWVLGSDHPDSLFEFSPPAGAHEIEMLRTDDLP